MSMIAFNVILIGGAVVLGAIVLAVVVALFFKGSDAAMDRLEERRKNRQSEESK